MVSGRGISGCTQDLNQNRRPAVCAAIEWTVYWQPKHPLPCLIASSLVPFAAPTKYPIPKEYKNIYLPVTFKCAHRYRRRHTLTERHRHSLSLCLCLSLSPGRRSFVGGRSCRGQFSGSNPLDVRIIRPLRKQGSSSPYIGLCTNHQLFVYESSVPCVRTTHQTSTCGSPTLYVRIIRQRPNRHAAGSPTPYVRIIRQRPNRHAAGSPTPYVRIIRQRPNRHAAGSPIPYVRIIRQRPNRHAAATKASQSEMASRCVVTTLAFTKAT